MGDFGPQELLGQLLLLAQLVLLVLHVLLFLLLPLIQLLLLLLVLYPTPGNTATHGPAFTPD